MIAKTEAPRSINNPTGLTLTTTLLTLPAHWAGYFINGEPEGIPRSDLTVAQSCERLYGVCSGCSEAAFFEPYHDARADGVLPADCLIYTFLQHDHA